MTAAERAATGSANFDDADIDRVIAKEHRKPVNYRDGISLIITVDRLLHLLQTIVYDCLSGL